MTSSARPALRLSTPPEVLCAMGEDTFRRLFDAEHRGRVDIVAAGVGDAVVLRGERQRGFLNDGQGVNIAAKRRGDGSFTDVNAQTGAFKPARRQSGSLKTLHQLVSGAEFLEGKLRVRVEIPAEVDQFRQERLQPWAH